MIIWPSAFPLKNKIKCSIFVPCENDVAMETAFMNPNETDVSNILLWFDFPWVKTASSFSKPFYSLLNMHL